LTRRRRQPSASTAAQAGAKGLSNSPDRSFEKIKKADLARLITVAATDCLESMLARSATGRFYSSDRVLMACLCQGAARHFVHGDCGVQDFDVVFFFATNPKWKFPPRWRGTRHFGKSRFGRNVDDGSRYLGRRIDIFGRDIPVADKKSPKDAIVAYLKARRTATAKFWSLRPVVALTPAKMLGQVIWKGAPR
jgi:hypothetical protein